MLKETCTLDPGCDNDVMEGSEVELGVGGSLRQVTYKDKGDELVWEERRLFVRLEMEM